MTPLWMEKHSPFITGPLAGIAALWITLEFGPVPLHAVAAAGLALLAAAAAVLTSRQRRAMEPMKGSRLMAYAHRTRYINDVRAYYAQGMKLSLAAAVTALAGLAAGGHTYLGPVWTSLAVATITADLHAIARNSVMTRRIGQRYQEELAGTLRI